MRSEIFICLFKNFKYMNINCYAEFIKVYIFISYMIVSVCMLYAMYYSMFVSDLIKLN